jgi:hypothetical protein
VPFEGFKYRNGAKGKDFSVIILIGKVGKKEKVNFVW